MTLSKYSDFNFITNIVELEENILFFKKNLIYLRFQNYTDKRMHSHLFKHFRRQIAQLNFKKSGSLPYLRNKTLNFKK